MNRPFLQRRSHRLPISLAVQSRTYESLRDQGAVSDLTAEGCCVRMDGDAFGVGTRVVIRGLQGMTGVVRWISGGFAGVEFDRPFQGTGADPLAGLQASFVPEHRALG